MLDGLAQKTPLLIVDPKEIFVEVREVFWGVHRGVV